MKKVSKKLLTDDLIIEKLNDKGIEEPGNVDKDVMIDILEEHFDCKMVFGDWPTYADFWFYIRCGRPYSLACKPCWHDPSIVKNQQIVCRHVF